jgi:hypothetical protein
VTQQVPHSQVVVVGPGENMDHWGSSFYLVNENRNNSFDISQLLVVKDIPCQRNYISRTNVTIKMKLIYNQPLRITSNN